MCPSRCLRWSIAVVARRFFILPIGTKGRAARQVNCIKIMSNPQKHECLKCHRGPVGATGLLVVLVALSALAGVGCTSVQVASPEERARFEAAGPIRPQLDRDLLAARLFSDETYRVLSGDVLEFRMPAVLTSQAEGTGRDPSGTVVHVTRVAADGNVTLPLVGKVEVGGLDVLEIEAIAVAAYHPRYVVQRPSIVVSVKEYRTWPVTIAGAVDKPGVYEFRHDRLSVLSVLMHAGGIQDDGARAIRIHRGDREEAEEPLVLPVHGTDTGFSDVPLQGGDVVEVERLDPQVFTVVGLVNSPGAFDYPRTARYNLMQAVAMAGGLNQTADPRYVTVYRQDESGEIISASFNVQGTEQTDASTVRIKPGDVVAVEQTPDTRRRLFLAEALRFQSGAVFNLAPRGGLY